jgi:tetratricopeptide (TPR) repeat protein
MRRPLFVALLFVLLCARAHASGYSELNAGIAANKNADWDGAIRHLTAALASPDLLPAFRPVALLDRGIAYAQKKQSDLALADYASCLAADPANREAYLARAALHAQRGQFAEVVADDTAVIALVPYFAPAYFERAAAYLALNQPDQAIADDSSALAILPDSFGGYWQRSGAYFAKQDYPDALADANESLRRNAHFAAGWTARGLIYQAMGDYSRALDDFNGWRNLLPDSREANMAVATAQWQIGRFDDAESGFSKIVQRWPDNSYGVIWLAIITANLGKDGGAAIAANTAHLSATRWPAPIIDFYLAKSTPDAVLRAAAAGDPKVRDGQICEAYFYVGEWQVLHADATGKADIATAASTCPRAFFEWTAANAELKRLL